MFGLFGSKPYLDHQLGELARSRGYWRGRISLDDGTSVALILSGGRAEPDPQAVADARAVTAGYTAWRVPIEAALFEHYEPYGDSPDSDDADGVGDATPVISSSDQIWRHVSLVYVAVTPLGGILTTELGFTVAWDEEHTLGARFRSGKLLELCGSVLVP
jgi:hypothetical protein